MNLHQLLCILEPPEPDIRLQRRVCDAKSGAQADVQLLHRSHHSDQRRQCELRQQTQLGSAQDDVRDHQMGLLSHVHTGSQDQDRDRTASPCGSERVCKTVHDPGSWGERARRPACSPGAHAPASAHATAHGDMPVPERQRAASPSLLRLKSMRSLRIAAGRSTPLPQAGSAPGTARSAADEPVTARCSAPSSVVYPRGNRPLGSAFEASRGSTSSRVHGSPESARGMMSQSEPWLSKPSRARLFAGEDSSLLDSSSSVHDSAPGSKNDAPPRFRPVTDLLLLRKPQVISLITPATLLRLKRKAASASVAARTRPAETVRREPPEAASAGTRSGSTHLSNSSVPAGRLRAPVGLQPGAATPITQTCHTRDAVDVIKARAGASGNSESCSDMRGGSTDRSARGTSRSLSAQRYRLRGAHPAAHASDALRLEGDSPTRQATPVGAQQQLPHGADAQTRCARPSLSDWCTARNASCKGDDQPPTAMGSNLSAPQPQYLAFNSSRSHASYPTSSWQGELTGQEAGHATGDTESARCAEPSSPPDPVPRAMFPTATRLSECLHSHPAGSAIGWFLRPVVDVAPPLDAGGSAVPEELQPLDTCPVACGEAAQMVSLGRACDWGLMLQAEAACCDARTSPTFATTVQQATEECRSIQPDHVPQSTLGGHSAVGLGKCGQFAGQSASSPHCWRDALATSSAPTASPLSTRSAWSPPPRIADRHHASLLPHVEEESRRAWLGQQADQQRAPTAACTIQRLPSVAEAVAGRASSLLHHMPHELQTNLSTLLQHSPDRSAMRHAVVAAELSASLTQQELPSGHELTTGWTEAYQRAEREHHAGHGMGPSRPLLPSDNCTDAGSIPTQLDATLVPCAAEHGRRGLLHGLDLDDLLQSPQPRDAPAAIGRVEDTPTSQGIADSQGWLQARVDQAPAASSSHRQHCIASLAADRSAGLGGAVTTTGGDRRHGGEAAAGLSSPMVQYDRRSAAPAADIVASMLGACAPPAACAGATSQALEATVVEVLQPHAAAQAPHAVGLLSGPGRISWRSAASVANAGSAAASPPGTTEQRVRLSLQGDPLLPMLQGGFKWHEHLWQPQQLHQQRLRRHNSVDRRLDSRGYVKSSDVGLGASGNTHLHLLLPHDDACVANQKAAAVSHRALGSTEHLPGLAQHDEHDGAAPASPTRDGHLHEARLAARHCLSAALCDAVEVAGEEDAVLGAMCERLATWPLLRAVLRAWADLAAWGGAHVTHQQHVQCRWCLQAWLQHLEGARRREAVWTDMAWVFHTRWTGQRTLARWCQAVLWGQGQRAREANHRKEALVRCFATWRVAADEKRAAVFFALCSRAHQQLRQAWSAWRQQCLFSAAVTDLLQRRQRRSLQAAWAAWCDAVLLTQVWWADAVTWHQRRVLSAVCGAWRWRYVPWQRAKRDRQALDAALVAELHRLARQRHMKWVMQAWLQQVGFTSSRQAKGAQLLYRCWQRGWLLEWRRVTVTLRHFRAAVFNHWRQQAVVSHHCATACQRGVLVAWRRAVSAGRAQALLVEGLVMLWARRRMRSSLLSMAQHAARSRAFSMLQMRVCSQTLRRCLYAWQHHVVRQQDKRAAGHAADAHHRTQLCAASLLSCHAAHRRRFHEALSVSRQQRCLHLMYNALAAWRWWGEVHAVGRALAGRRCCTLQRRCLAAWWEVGVGAQRADDYQVLRLLRLMLLCFAEWSRVSRHLAERRQRLHCAVALQPQRMGRRTLQAWHRAATADMVAAASHWRLRLLAVAFVEWQEAADGASSLRIWLSHLLLGAVSSALDTWEQHCPAAVLARQHWMRRRLAAVMLHWRSVRIRSVQGAHLQHGLKRRMQQELMLGYWRNAALSERFRLHHRGLPACWAAWRRVMDISVHAAWGFRYWRLLHTSLRCWYAAMAAAKAAAAVTTRRMFHPLLLHTPGQQAATRGAGSSGPAALARSAATLQRSALLWGQRAAHGPRSLQALTAAASRQAVVPAARRLDLQDRACGDGSTEAQWQQGWEPGQQASSGASRRHCGQDLFHSPRLEGGEVGVGDGKRDVRMRPGSASRADRRGTHMAATDPTFTGRTGGLLRPAWQQDGSPTVGRASRLEVPSWALGAVTSQAAAVRLGRAKWLRMQRMSAQAYEDASTVHPGAAQAPHKPRGRGRGATTQPTSAPSASSGGGLQHSISAVELDDGKHTSPSRMRGAPPGHANRTASVFVDATSASTSGAVLVRASGRPDVDQQLVPGMRRAQQLAAERVSEPDNLSCHVPRRSDDSGVDTATCIPSRDQALLTNVLRGEDCQRGMSYTVLARAAHARADSPKPISQSMQPNRALTAPTEPCSPAPRHVRQMYNDHPSRLLSGVAGGVPGASNISSGLELPSSRLANVDPEQLLSWLEADVGGWYDSVLRPSTAACRASTSKRTLPT